MSAFGVQRSVNINPPDGSGDVLAGDGNLGDLTHGLTLSKLSKPALMTGSGWEGTVLPSFQKILGYLFSPSFLELWEHLGSAEN